ncbi:putative phosphatidylglycerol/phosphatidylinositol transfer protein DDB_G0282179 [Chenopodium quinoa]|uniref:putative phosphatidylglycerol/phosphatidylinositol transfer protein DDB_G0282179 n=1 Tax=Chenopodium quinoa TaxID=63459 RepID=UPI000B784BFC|nr:putative phosphatidylglycerol/phosphatidylinositol transfer protein DDB_G0282179 [Chenopodium quinoa]
MMRYTAITLILLSLLLFILSPSAHATDIRYCDKKTDYEVKVHGVEISPDPVARGQPATFSIAASAGNAISGGKLDLDVAYFGWHVHSETRDLCTETSCPVSTGDFVISHSQVLPIFTPPGSYTLKMKILDANKRQLSCVAFDFSIGFGSSMAANFLM